MGGVLFKNFCLLLYVWFDALCPSRQFCGHFLSSWVVLRSTKQLIKCHAQGHNTITAGGKSQTSNHATSSLELHQATALRPRIFSDVPEKLDKERY